MKNEDMEEKNEVTHHTVHSYDKALETLTGLIVTMGALTADLIMLACNSVENSDRSFVEEAEEIDEKINKLDTEIELEATTILALRQPVAIDLRHLTASLKISLILERMGDLSKDVTRKINESHFKPSEVMKKEVRAMTNLVLQMLENVLEAFQERDKAKAEEVLATDCQVNDIYAFLLKELQEEIMRDPKQTAALVKVIFAVKRFERLGDYSTKIAKLVHYVASGSRSMHKVI